jgi:subtilisin-like proprotein convertase family protein
MKKTKPFTAVVIFIFCLAFLVLLESCSKSEDATPVEDKLQLPALIANTTEMIIPDATFLTGNCGNQTTPGTIENSIVIDKSGTIANANKVTIELDLSHNYAGDLAIQLTSPSGKTFGILKRLGSTADNDCGVGSRFVGGNIININSDQSLPAVYAPTNTTIPPGNYHATQGSTSFPNMSMLGVYSHLTGENVKGIWKLKIQDFGVGANTRGSVVSWKLKFEVGALQ